MSNVDQRKYPGSEVNKPEIQIYLKQSFRGEKSINGHWVINTGILLWYQ
jgi:hypothetical protein